MKPNHNDPHHVTLHLIQSLASRQMDLEAKILQEREAALAAIGDTSFVREELRSKRKQLIIAQQALQDVVSYSPKSLGAGYASRALERLAEFDAEEVDS